MSEHDDAERQADRDTERPTRRERLSPSRRTVLRGVAAGTAAGFTGLSSAEMANGAGTNLQDDGQDGQFFERGTEVGVRMVADGPLVAPTDFAVAEDDDRQFVTDQTGEVYVIDDDGVREEPFVDVSDRMVELGTFYGLYADPQQDYDERGLLGIEMHPDFAENGRFYLHYSAPPTEELRSISWDHVEVIAEYAASDDLESADLESERRLLEIPSPQYNHDSGPMAFGPDGYLYVPMGDGGGANDDMYGHVPDWYEQNTGGNGQDVVNNLLGDVLRIDVDSEDEDRPYGIPEDNPFTGDATGRDEIYAYGFRNPFGISFDSQGRMFVADAGQNLFEEASIVERGGNYGWNVKEGTHCFSTQRPSIPPAECPDSEPNDDPYDGSPLIDPMVEYPHQYQNEWVGIVIVGGHFYEQDTVPDLQGKYVFGDWTKDPQREEPAGRLLAATDPDGGAETTPETTPAGDGVETTPDDAETTPEDEVTPAGKTTPGADGEGTPPEPGEEEDVRAVPRDQLWEMEELVVAGSEDGTLDWFVRQFGRGTDGEIYVLVSRRGVPEEETGAVLQIVPPDEGDGSATVEQETETTPDEGGETTPGETTPEATPAGKTTPQAGEEETETEADEGADDADETTTETDDEDDTDALGTLVRDR